MEDASADRLIEDHSDGLLQAEVWPLDSEVNLRARKVSSFEGISRAMGCVD
jgi:hypothetical protein